MRHPKDVGDHTTLAVMLALNESGYQVATPFGEATRYDLIIDDGETLLRVRCKTGRMRGGAVEFATASSYAHHPNDKVTQRHYLGQIDHFAVYCRETGGVYLIPIGVLPLDRAYLRITTPQNGQRKRIRYAKDYEMPRSHAPFQAARDGTADHPNRGASHRWIARDTLSSPPVECPAAGRRIGLGRNRARFLVRDDLALHPLQCIVDRLRVTFELGRHRVVGLAVEVEP